MRRRALAPFARPFLLRSCLFLVALLAVLFVLAAPIQASSGLAAPEDVIVEAAQEGVLITWTNQASQGGVQYTLYRGASAVWQEAVAVDALFSSAVRLEPPNVSYSFYDQSAVAGASYVYWVVAETGAESVRFGPYYSTQTHVVFLPLLARS